MSVIVKGVSVPKNCYTCAKYGWSPLCPCWRGDAEASYYRTRRHPDCPLISVTTPHGRLIDADALLSDDEIVQILTSNPQRTGKLIKEFAEMFVDKVNRQPTIIEAEGREE